MMLWYWLKRKFPPRFLIAGGILLSSLLALLVWNLTRGGGDGGSAPASSAVAASVAELPTPAKISFALGDVVLCGNTLINHRTGEILHHEWLKGFGSSQPEVAATFPEENLLVAMTGKGPPQAYDFEGNPRAVVELDGKPLGPAAYVDRMRHVMFVRDGDLWSGEVNWRHSTVGQVKKITDVGYFRNDLFSNRWFLHHETLLATGHGNVLEIGLVDGTVKEIAANIAALTAGTGPGASYCLLPLDWTKLAILDLFSGESKTYTVGEKTLGFLWLDENRVIIRVGQHKLAEYDHSTKKLGEPKAFGDRIAMVTGLSPSKRKYLIVGAKGLHVAEVESGKSILLDLPVDQCEWVGEDELLCSVSVVDSETRGIWLVDGTGGKRRLSNRPMDVNRSSRNAGSPVVRVAGGAVFVSGGELWRYDEKSREIKQVTNGASATPGLKALDLPE